MINIFSIRCGLAFAPYLAESISAFVKDREFAPRVVRQAGSGLIIRSDVQMMLRFQNREAALNEEEAKHYRSTIRFRREFYDIERMQDEVVFANVGADLLLSHAQSELWLEASHVSHLLRIFSGDSTQEAKADSPAFPNWLNISAAAGRLLISDQRTGRWVLLGRDHIEELERRLMSLDAAVASSPARAKPPTFSLKGLAVHLQSALKLVEALESFAETGEVRAFEEITPTYSLIASKSVEGIELKDSDRRVGLNSREARKYAALIRDELERLNVKQVERGRIRTVFADDKDGRWVLQWGDEVFIPANLLQQICLIEDPQRNLNGRVIIGRTEDFLLLLSPLDGGCIALTESEVKQLTASA